jgi:hypothetical protein
MNQDSAGLLEIDSTHSVVFIYSRITSQFDDSIDSQVA